MSAPVPLTPELMLVARCSECGAPMVSPKSVSTGIGPRCRDKQKKKSGLDTPAKKSVQTANQSHR